MYADTPSEFLFFKRTLAFSSGSPIHALGSELMLGSDDGSGIEMLTGGIEMHTYIHTYITCIRTYIIHLRTFTCFSRSNAADSEVWIGAKAARENVSTPRGY